MKFTKKIVAVVAGVAMCAGLAACGGSRSGQATGGDAKIEKGATIGISMPTKSEERWNKDGNNLKAKLEKAGYKVILSFADDKPAQQNADIENMVNNDAKIVVVASKDGTAVGPAVEKARDAGAKVIAYDRLIMNTDAVDYYATFQLEQVGVLEATWLIDQLKLKDGATGPFNIELFTGSPDDNNAKYFFKGAWDLLQPYFEKGVLVSPSQHGQGGVTKDFTVEDSAFGFIVMKNGATVSLESSWALNMLDTREACTLLCGTNAGIDMNNGVRINGVRGGKLYELYPALDGKGVDFYDASGEEAPADREARLWIDAVINDKTPVVTPEQAYCVSRILNGIYESAKTGEPYYFD